MITIHNKNVFKFMATTEQSWDTVFIDPNDNIGLKYDGFKDKIDDKVYLQSLGYVIYQASLKSNCVWVSFNAKWLQWTNILTGILDSETHEVKFCVQTFTFYQHNRFDLGNGFRPILRVLRKGTTLNTDSVRVESERQKAGDKRADPRGKVPSDVFEFPRVVGNSSQRRSWHPTQLNEGLVERCLKLTTPEGGDVLDLYGGTGTTSRVAYRLGFDSDYVDVSRQYCNMFAEDCRENNREFKCLKPF